MNLGHGHLFGLLFFGVLIDVREDRRDREMRDERDDERPAEKAANLFAGGDEAAAFCHELLGYTLGRALDVVGQAEVGKIDLISPRPSLAESCRSSLSDRP